MARYADIRREFCARFSGEPEFFSASGRSEIIGNHTDHNRGAVMAAGIDLDAIGAARGTAGSIIRIWDKGYGKEFDLDISALEPKESERGGFGSPCSFVCPLDGRQSFLECGTAGFLAFL